ncbi:MAG TPA: ABC transporter permease [Vicinamibacterales bacterium]|nr:ABC transporter permease [Vicinamibacterales bacterium]
MREHGFSRAAYRLLLRLYPRGFRERFARDLEADFLEMARTRGPAFAWRRALADVVRAVPLTASDAAGERARTARIGGPIAPPGDPFMRSLLFDVRHAVRALLKAPAFTIVTILTLALGIGANSAVFSLVNAVLLRPLGFADPERLMFVYEAIPESGVALFDVSPPDYLDLVQYQRSFSAIGAHRTRMMELSGSGQPEQIDAAEITSSLFGVLGVGAAQGRVFLAGEDQQESDVAIISHGLWRRRFDGREALGAAIVLDRKPYTIVGIMPAGFEFPRRGAASNATPAEVWLPLVFTPFEKQARSMMYNHSVIGRLRDGMSPAQAAADTAALARRIQDNYPAAIRNAFTLVIGTKMLTDELSGQVRRPLMILLGAVGLVLLVTCANVANLILSRSVARQRDIGVRAALGAGRLRLFQVLLGEALLLAACGGALGLALGYWGLKTIPAVLTTSLPGIGDVVLDWRVVAFTSALSLGSAIVFALVPLVAGMRRNLHDLLREGSARATGGRRQHRLQSGLVVTSVAFAFILLVLAGLFIRSFRNLVSVESGVGATNVLSLQVRLPFAAYNEGPRIRWFYRALEEQLRTLPGVRAVSIASDLPLEPDGERRAFTPENSATEGLQQTTAVTWVHGDFFGTYGIPIFTGRAFSSDEQRENRDVAIVSKRLASSYWPGGNPLGKRLKWGLPMSTAPWLTVVGVAGDVVEGPPGSDPLIHVYVPYTNVPDAGLAHPLAGLWRRLVIGVHGNQDALTFAGSARAMIAALDPALAISDVRTIAQLERDRSAPQRFSAMVISGFGAGALLLASIGLYGVLAFSVSQRTREIAVRLALGAPRGDVLRLTVREGMTLVAIGLVIGAIGAAAATRLLRATLFETSVYDPLTFATVPLLLGFVALAASCLPARRAAAVDPIIALRMD